MKILGLVDAYLFGEYDEQDGMEQREKLWYYVPLILTILIGLIMLQTI